MADQNFYTNDPFGQVIRVLDTYRGQQRQLEDQDLDRKIALLHDLITGPGANPARTAEGLKSILELQSAKGGRGKPKKGAAGFLGQNEEMMPHLLAQIIHGDIPMEGPTTETIQHPGFENQAVEPINPMAMGGAHEMPKFDGQSVLNEPIAVPPPPMNTPPSGSRMLSAARQMQTEQPLPMSKQPMRIAPDELAQREGRAAGIKAGATSKATKDAQIQIWREAGLTDQEIQQLLKTQAMGAGANLQTQDAGYFKVGDSIRHAIRTLNPRTGTWDTVDELSGLPIPPGAAVIAAPSASGTTDPTSIKEFHAVVADETNRLGYSPTEEKGFDAWLTSDANRKAGANLIRNAQGFTGPQQFSALNRLQTLWNKESKAYSTMINQYNLMQAGFQAAEQGMLNPASQAVLVTFQKILDPSSVVRESEYARSPEGLGLIARIQGQIQRIQAGGAGVPPAQLKEFVVTARQFIKNMEGSVSSVRGQVNAGAAMAGIDPQQVFGSETGLPTMMGTPSTTPNVPAPPGAANQSGAAPKEVTQAQIQQYAADHGNIPYEVAKRVFTDKQYTVTGETTIPTPPAAAPVKKK